MSENTLSRQDFLRYASVGLSTLFAPRLIKLSSEQIYDEKEVLITNFLTSEPVINAAISASEKLIRSGMLVPTDFPNDAYVSHDINETKNRDYLPMKDIITDAMAIYGGTCSHRTIEVYNLVKFREKFAQSLRVNADLISEEFSDINQLSPSQRAALLLNPSFLELLFVTSTSQMQDVLNVNGDAGLILSEMRSNNGFDVICQIQFSHFFGEKCDVSKKLNSIIDYCNGLREKQKDPLSSVQILEHFIRIHKGNIDNALWDVAFFYKMMARNDLTTGEILEFDVDVIKRRSEWFANMFKNDVCPNGFTHSELEDYVNKQEKPIDYYYYVKNGEFIHSPNLGPYNQLGILYHNYFLYAAASLLPREMVKLFSLAELIISSKSHQSIKCLSDLHALQQLEEVNLFLQSINET